MIENGIIYSPLMFQFGFNPNKSNFYQAELLFFELLNRYTQVHRAYHTITHLEALGKEYFSSCSKEPVREPSREMCLAILYHDAVYELEPYNQNELESVNLFKKHAEILTVSQHIVDVVEELILSTNQALNYPPSRLTDLDLLILSSDIEEYEKYSKRIKLEWKHCDDALYKKERSKFLSQLLTRETIYNDPSLAQRNVQARKNMQLELEILTVAGTTMTDWSLYLQKGDSIECLQHE